MYRRDDPRLRRTLDQLSHNVEHATETAQEGLYSFSQNYITPCLSSFAGSLKSCTESCFPSKEEQRRRRHRVRSRGHAEASFDFYDDWDEDENEGLLGWGNSNDELDRLLAGSGGSQPRRERTMSYGTRSGDQRTRRKSAAHLDIPDPNVIPQSNKIGFLERLPWNLGRKALRYKPSAADLQEHPGANRVSLSAPEAEPLMEDSDEEVLETSRHRRNHKRNRSLTATSGTSGHTVDSLSSRGDLFPSEDEDDAIPLDDEFAFANLERRTTGEDSSSGKSRPRGSKTNSRLSLRTVSSKSTHSSSERKASSSKRKSDVQLAEPPTFHELKAEEEMVQQEEEQEVARKRDAAQRLAAHRGFSSGNTSSKSETRSSSPKPDMTDIGSKSSSLKDTFPFPTFNPPPETQSPQLEDDRRIELAPEIVDEETLASSPPPEEDDFMPAALPRFLRSSPTP